MFDIDHEGLKKLIAKRGKVWILAELIQNAWDAEGASRVDVTLQPIADRRGMAELRVEDDSPNGFPDLAHAYTLFAPSHKLSNPRLRGRFNLGEKLVVAYAESASIITTTGAVIFERGERRKGRQRRQQGTLFEAVLPMTRDEITDTISSAQRFISPPGIKTVINGAMLATRKSVRQFECALQTVVINEEGYLMRSERTGTVELYGKAENRAWLYEMGIPVVELGDDMYDVNVGQRVPLGWNRDNVPPTWLRRLREKILTHSSDLLSEEGASSVATTSALAGADPEAIRQVINIRFHKGLAYDPSDPEANKRAVAHGHQIVHGGTFDKPTWDAIRGAGALPPAGQKFPTPKPFAEGGKPPQRVPETPAMARFHKFAVDLARHLLGHAILVRFYERLNDDHILACYGDSKLTFNMRRLGKRWFEGPLQKKHLDLLIHEFGHDISGDHLSSQYYRALTMLGAKLALLALDQPELFRLPGATGRNAA